MQTSLRNCKKCNTEHPLDYFPKHDTGGHRHECKDCYGKRMAEWRGRNLYAIKAKSKLKFQLLKADKAKYEKAKVRQRITGKEWNARVRDEVYAAYGGPICACCGETEPNFLTIDHINNDGHLHRKNTPGATNLYTHLRARGFPSGFQVLCMNCNFGKARNKGVCPHKSRQEGSETIAQASTLK